MNRRLEYRHVRDAAGPQGGIRRVVPRFGRRCTDPIVP
jgi:hypothetical protein